MTPTPSLGSTIGLLWRLSFTFILLKNFLVYGEGSNVLEFQQAYQYVVTNALKLKAAEAELGIREAERWQAGLYPNPDLTVSFDDIGRSRKWDDNEFSIGLTQLFELGGKRNARLRVANAAQCQTSWDFEIVKCDLYAELLHAFINTATAQERIAIAFDLLKIAESSFQCISAKAANGKATAIDSKKSEIALKSAQLQLLKRQAIAHQAKTALAALWNSNAATFESIAFPLFNIIPPPPLQALENEIANNPELSKSHAELSKAWELIELERTQQTPDLALYVGVSTEDFYRQPALSIGIDIPLPIFDRNQGNIARASHEYNQILFRQMDFAAQLQARIAVLYEEWTTAYEQAAALQDIVTTTAKETYQLSQESYELGNCDYLEFLDARTTLFNIRQQYLDAIEEYHHKHAEIIKLTTKCCIPILSE
jgi:outer membrane protein, heavy metal efflux system